MQGRPGDRTTSGNIAAANSHASAANGDTHIACDCANSAHRDTCSADSDASAADGHANCFTYRYANANPRAGLVARL